jgi:threonine/homoserine/homoserine lactone efflux protein
MPPFLTGNATSVTAEMILLGAVFMTITFATFVCYGTFAAIARDRLLQNVAVMRWLNRSFAALFAALGARLAFEQP